MYYLDTNEANIHFKRTLNSEIYVDKSLLIQKLNKVLNTGQNYICITRPRRFGKTVNAKMLGAYYTIGYDSHEMFENLEISKIETYKKHLNQHHVIYIDFSRMPDPCDSFNDYLNWVKFCIKSDVKEAFGCESIQGEPIQELIKKTGETFIFIMDEWDSVFYEKFMDVDAKQTYLKFLKGLLKDQPYVELAYMTGVLPIAKYSSGSELNTPKGAQSVFREHNFMNDRLYEDYFGFDEEEVKALCTRFPRVPYEELKCW